MRSHAAEDIQAIGDAGIRHLLRGDSASGARGAPGRHARAGVSSTGRRVETGGVSSDRLVGIAADSERITGTRSPCEDMDGRIHALAEKLWNYHQLHHQLAPADAILVLCSHDTSVAERGAQLFLDGWAPILIFSGGLGTITRHLWQVP